MLLCCLGTWLMLILKYVRHSSGKVRALAPVLVLAQGLNDFAKTTSNLLRCCTAQSVQAQLNDREHDACSMLPEHAVRIQAWCQARHAGFLQPMLCLGPHDTNACVFQHSFLQLPKQIRLLRCYGVYQFDFASEYVMLTG